MISMVFGTPGSGKTTLGAWCAVRAASGRPLRAAGHWMQDFREYDHIYTNFAVNIPGVREWSLDMMGKDVCSRSLMVIDEVAQIWDARNFKNFDSDVKAWFALHRHYKSDVILISQGYNDVDLRIRNCAEQTFLLEPWYLGFSKLTAIVKYARLEMGTINEGYEEDGSSLIYRPALYPYFDTYAAPARPPAPLPPCYTTTPPSLRLVDRVSAVLAGLPSSPPASSDLNRLETPLVSKTD